MTDTVFYSDVGSSKKLHSIFTFQIPAPGYSGDYETIEFDKKGNVTVFPGFSWDGASGPTIDTPDTVCAALGHDVVYKLMGQRLLPSTYKDYADKWFYDRLIKDGVLSFRAFAWYKAVQLFGIPKHSLDVVKRAPKPLETETITNYSPLVGRFV
jgi:hypothetical protein